MGESTSGARELRPHAEEMAGLQPLNRLLLDLHDGSVQYMYTALLQLDLLEREIGRAPREAVGERVDQVRRLVEAALGEIRTFIGALRSSPCETDDLASLLRGLAAEHERHTGTPVAVIIEGDPPEAPLAVRIALYRVVQEALANAYRHAGATWVTVHLTAARSLAEPTLRLTIADEGIGFTPGALALGRHVGLHGMRERIEAVGGSFQVCSQPGAGTTIAVALTLP